MTAGKGRREGLAGGGSVLCPDAQMCPQKLTRLTKWGWLFACSPPNHPGLPLLGTVPSPSTAWLKLSNHPVVPLLPQARWWWGFWEREEFSPLSLANFYWTEFKTVNCCLGAWSCWRGAVGVPGVLRGGGCAAVLGLAVVLYVHGADTGRLQGQVGTGPQAGLFGPPGQQPQSSPEPRGSAQPGVPKSAVRQCRVERGGRMWD